MTFELVIFDSDPRSISDLEARFSDLTSVTIKGVEKMLYLQPPGDIDVLYLPLSAAERWGSKPLIHESQILPTRLEDQEKGLPAYIVTGTCLSDDDARGPVPEMTLLVDSVFRAVRTFNKGSDTKLKRVGFWGYNLLKGLDAAQLRKIIEDVVPELV